MTSKQERWVTRQEAADALGVTRKRVDQLRRLDKLTAVKVGLRAVGITVSSLSAELERRNAAIGQPIAGRALPDARKLG